MSSEKKSAGASAARPEKVPKAVMHEMQIAVAMHRREYGNKHYDLVRERADIARWIGKEAGETGRKRFQRMVQNVAKPLSKDRTRPHQSRKINEEQLAWAGDEARHTNRGSNSLMQISPAQVMSGGGAALAGFAEARKFLVEGADDLERVRQAALIDDPNGYKGKSAALPELLLKATKASCQLAVTTATLTREYSAVFVSRAFAESLVEFLLVEFAMEPERGARVIEQLADLIGKTGGLPPQVH